MWGGWCVTHRLALADAEQIVTGCKVTDCPGEVPWVEDVLDRPGRRMACAAGHSWTELFMPATWVRIEID